jgi:hypothetical protein
MGPEDRAVGPERDRLRAGPAGHHVLLDTADRHHDRRGVGCIAVQGPPADLPRGLFKGHHSPAILPSDLQDEQVAVDQRGARVPPVGPLGGERLGQIHLPDLRPIGRLEGE